MDNRLQVSSLLAGNGSVQTYLRNGLHLNTEPIEEIIILETQNVIAANTYNWNLGELGLAFKPIALYADYAAAAAGTITFKTKYLGADIYTFSIPGATAAVGFTFPFLVIQPKYLVEMSVTAPVNRISILGKPVNIIDVISAS